MNIGRASDEVQSLLRMAGWAVALPLARRIWPVQNIQQAMSPAHAPAPKPEDSPLPQWALRLWRALYNRPSANCLERSLQLVALLRRHGRPVKLAMGFRKQGDEMLGHAWVTNEAGEPVYRELGDDGDVHDATPEKNPSDESGATISI